MLEISFQNSIQHAFAGMELALQYLVSSFQNSNPDTFAGIEFVPKEQGPNLEGSLVRQTLRRVSGFQLIPGIQKYHMKVKRRGATVKSRAKKLLLYPIPGRDALETSFLNSIQHTFAGMELAPKDFVSSF